jgi:hypothetical protein
VLERVKGPWPPEISRRATIAESKEMATGAIQGLRMVSRKKLAECVGKIHGVNSHKKHDDSEQTDLLSPAENGLTGSNVPIESALIQVCIRKHDIPLAVDDVAFPILEAHGAK